MPTWVCVPSARPVAEVRAWAAHWHERGYKVALWRDRAEPELKTCQIDWLTIDTYPGYAQAANSLIASVLKVDPSCDWCVATGDDTFPDMGHRADEIASQCSEHFRKLALSKLLGDRKECFIAAMEDGVKLQTFGVCQPTGDRFAEGSIDRICGSPWLGREFCRRINQGRGPFWPEYTHCFGDEELQNVAEKLGILWQRRDLIHYHQHYTRVPGRDIGQVKAPPPHLVEATSAAHWVKYKALFEKRKAEGFPGSAPL